MAGYWHSVEECVRSRVKNVNKLGGVASIFIHLCCVFNLVAYHLMRDYLEATSVP